MTSSIDIKEIRKILAADEPATLLDVRRKSDYQASPQKVKGAVWRDPEKIDTWIKQLPVGRRTVVYCAKGGSVSQSVTDRLRREGIDAVFLEGGFRNWIESGEPLAPR